MKSSLPVLHCDPRVLVVHKPSGLLTHRGWGHEHDTALVRARELVGRYVYPIHRLDRGTSGALLFALDAEAAADLGRQREAGTLRKRYLAIVRGPLEQALEIDYPLRPLDDGRPVEGEARQAARSSVRPLGSFERYTLVEAVPHTGRAHQLRRHLKHVSHPIVGDTRYGDGRHNRACRERFGLTRLALHALRIAFLHPDTGLPCSIVAPLPLDLAEPLAAMSIDASPPVVGG